MATPTYTEAQTLLTIEKALKENYLPLWNNQLGITPSALLAKIKKVPLKGDKIVAAAEVGLSGGFGYGAEGQATPTAGGVIFERFETRSKDMYSNVVISEKTVALANGNAGSIAPGLHSEMKGCYAAADWHVGRSLFMDGTGVLTKISALTEAGTTITVANTKYLKEGIIIDIYEGDPTNVAAAVQANGKARRIKSIDRKNKTITLYGDAATFKAGFITVQNSFMREIDGLGAIFNENITSIYGVNKAENPFVKPVEVDAEGSISDSVITRALRESKNVKNGNINMLLASDEAYDAYVEYLRTNNIRVEDSTYEIAGGFKAIKFVFGKEIVDIVNESFVPAGEIWGVDTNSLQMHWLDWRFAELQGGGIFNLMEQSSLYRALLRNYGNLICTNPGACVRIANVDYVAG